MWRRYKRGRECWGGEGALNMSIHIESFCVLGAQREKVGGFQWVCTTVNGGGFASKKRRRGR